MVSQPGLGEDLRKLREKSKMSTRSVAEKLGVSHASVNRTELGKRRVDPDEVIALCALYGVTGRQRERLIERARGDLSNTTWYSDGSEAAEQVSSLMDLEAEATHITTVDLTMVPGLLQTPEYTQEIISRSRTLSAHEVDTLARARLSRQSVLSQPNAPEVRFILDEALLHRQVGGREVMRDQLLQLLRAAHGTNVTIQVLPLNMGGHAAVDGAFMLFRFPDQEPHVTVESRGGVLFLSLAEQVKPYQQVVEDLDGSVLSVEDSAVLIAEVRERMRDA
jgi:transcriptional regulator with XRE-family HTH domain